MKRSVLIPFYFCSIISLLCVMGKSAQGQSLPEIEGWYFRVIGGYPVTVTFEPVVLFKNGEFFSVGKEPVGDLNVAQSKKERPAAWGTWKRDGEVFLLTNHKNKTYDYKLGSGSWFPAYPYSTAYPLKSSYENVSGGDYGNGMHALFNTSVQFKDGQYFALGTDSGVLTPGAAAWKKSKSVGTYTIEGHTITFHYNDGHEVKMSFALSASGNPASPSSKMIFIGGDVFVEDDD